MRSVLSLTLLSVWSVCLPAVAQITVPPVVAPHTPIVATCDVPAAGEAGSVQVLWESDADYLALEGGAKLHIWAAPGEHYLKASVFAVDWESRTFEVRQHRATFRVGDQPTPEPDEPEPPLPKPSQVTAVIIHETQDATPAFSRMVTGLRSGPSADWLKAGGHELLVLDDDATDSSGQPLDLVATLKAMGVGMPALFVLDGDKVLLKTTLPSSAKSTDVVTQIREVVE